VYTVCPDTTPQNVSGKSKPSCAFQSGFRPETNFDRKGRLFQPALEVLARYCIAQGFRHFNKIIRFWLSPMTGGTVDPMEHTYPRRSTITTDPELRPRRVLLW